MNAIIDASDFDRKLAHQNWRSLSPSRNDGQNDELVKLDTNKEEEVRLLHLENDIMHKAFIEKSHRLNLEDA